MGKVGQGNPPPDTDLEGVARMAAARLHAGIPLSDRDKQALQAHPTPDPSTMKATT